MNRITCRDERGIKISLLLNALILFIIISSAVLCIGANVDVINYMVTRNEFSNSDALILVS